MVDTEPPLQEELIKEDSVIMPSLPNEVIVEILSFLPVESILRFRCVCKPWYKLFKDPVFVNYHREQAIAQGQAVEMDHPFKAQYNSTGSNLDILGSCNGLILMKLATRYRQAKYAHIDLFLWNPSTTECKKLPKVLIKGKYPNKYQYGLGYNSIIDDYKIIRIDVFYNRDATVFYGCRVNVYTLGSNSWETLPNIIPYHISSIKPLLVNGFLNWVGTPVDEQGDTTGSRVIVSFNLENNTWNEVPVTQQLDELLGHDGNAHHSIEVSPFHDVLLGNLDGCLCIIGDFKTCGVITNFEIWVMKDYGVRESWSEVYSGTIDSIESSIIMLYRMKVVDFVNGKVIFTGDSQVGVSLVIYDPKHETSRLVNNQDILVRRSQMEIYVESLVPLNSGTEIGCSSGTKAWGDKKERPRKRKFTEWQGEMEETPY